MKKLVLLSFVLFANVSFSQNENSQNQLNDLVKVISGLIKKDDPTTPTAPFYKEILSTNAVVNSSSKARFGGGKTRAGFPINLPFGTTVWFYRVTVVDVNSTFTYPNQEKFFYLLKNNGLFSVKNENNYGIDVFVLDDFNIKNFLETGNDNFSAYSEYTKLNSNGVLNSSKLIKNNLWIGVRNPNATQGLKVIVEVVAFGNF